VAKKRVLLLIESSRGHGRGMLEGVSQFLQETDDWNVSYEDHAVLDRLPKKLSQWQGDGMIVRSHNTATCDFLLHHGIAYLELLGDGGEHQPAVRVDEGRVGQLAAEHLHERGIRNFAYFSADRLWWSRVREKAFRTALQASYHTNCASWLLPTKQLARFPLSTIPQQVSETISDWLKNLPKPVGIFTSIDLHAMLLLGICHSSGVLVPEEVALLGAGNDRLVCSLLAPKLSSVALNSRLIGYRAAERLDEMMHDSSRSYEPIIVPPTHVAIRQSTDMIAVEDPLVAKALSYIRDAYAQPVGVNDIAKRLEVSRRTLERRFRQWMPRSPEAELIKVRLERAKELLRDTNLPIAKIGERVGFRSPEYFSNTFRRKQGLTPNQYRLECQIGPAGFLAVELLE